MFFRILFRLRQSDLGKKDYLVRKSVVHVGKKHVLYGHQGYLVRPRRALWPAGLPYCPQSGIIPAAFQHLLRLSHYLFDLFPVHRTVSVVLGDERSVLFHQVELGARRRRYHVLLSSRDGRGESVSILKRYAEDTAGTDIGTVLEVSSTADAEDLQRFVLRSARNGGIYQDFPIAGSTLDATCQNFRLLCPSY